MLPARTLPTFRHVQTGLAKLTWPQPPRNIFVAKKNLDPKVSHRAREFLQHLHEKYPVNLLVEPESQEELKLPFLYPVKNPKEFEEHTDAVVTMGGDGTMLNAMAIFKHKSLDMPPVLSFSMGTLGFLLPFNYRDSQTAFDELYNGQSLVNKRSRLRVTMPDTNKFLHALNEVTIHRGGSSHLAELDIAIDGQHLTTAIADGVSISTPTGSTAYSLSSGGSIVHPGVESILLTPICPRSLSFRPLLFPQTSHVSISIASNARGSSTLSLDGDDSGRLKKGNKISMEVRPDEGVWCVSQNTDTDDWVRHVNGLLGFNSKFGTY